MPRAGDNVLPVRFALVGVTASGKTALSITLARRFDAEILAADAMTIWRGLDVGTAKPSVEQRRAVRHHLLDLFEPGERPTVAAVAEAGRGVLAGLAERGKAALVVGGSGLYVRAVLDDLEFPPTDPGLRAELEALAPDALVRRLREVDPGSFAHVDPANHRRVVRALEISLLTGEPASSRRDAWSRRAAVPMVGLDLADRILEERILDRTARMLDGGWLEECRRFDESGRREAVLATRAIGYPEVFALLDGSISRDDAEDRIGRATLQLAKRQRTWFRADPRVRWIDAADPEAAVAEAERIFASDAGAERHT